jgi:hypothetical protein
MTKGKGAATTRQLQSPCSGGQTTRGVALACSQILMASGLCRTTRIGNTKESHDLALLMEEGSREIRV